MGEFLQAPSTATTLSLPTRDPIASSDELLTIEEVAQRLGMSTATVRLRVSQRYFHPIKVKHRLMFHPSEVEAELARVETLRLQQRGAIPHPNTFRKPKPQPPEPVPEKSVKPKTTELMIKPSDSFQVGALVYNGQQCAAAVKLFREGKNVLDVVSMMEITFEIAKHFWRQYLELQQVWILPHKQFAQLRLLLDWEEDPATPEGFIKAMREHMDKVVDRETKAAIARELGQEISDEEKEELARLDAEIAAGAERKKSSSVTSSAKKESP